MYGRNTSGNTMRWYRRYSTGSSFGGYITMISDAGDPGDAFLVADFTGDGRADLYVGDRLRTATSKTGAVAWRVHFTYDGSTWASPVLANPAWGGPGSLYRLGRIDPDGRTDLVGSVPFFGINLWTAAHAISESLIDQSPFPGGFTAAGDFHWIYP